MVHPIAVPVKSKLPAQFGGTASFAEPSPDKHNAEFTRGLTRLRGWGIRQNYLELDAVPDRFAKVVADWERGILATTS